MKIFILISFSIIAISCSKVNQQETEKDLELNITNTEWRTSISKQGFGEVYLKIEGNSNGELVTIETYGDWLVGCKELRFDENNNFSGEIMVRFEPYWDSIPKKHQTYVNVYEKSESPEIVIFRTGTGKRIRKMVESDFLTFYQ